MRIRPILISDFKPMPLPVERPAERVPRDEALRSHGIDRIDRLMSQESADNERYKHPESKLLGGGMDGIAIDIGNNRAKKYTVQYQEYANAVALLEGMAKAPECFPKIYDVGSIMEENQSIFVIEMDKVRTLTGLEYEKLKQLYMVYAPEAAEEKMLHPLCRQKDGIIARDPSMAKIINDLCNLYYDLEDAGIRTTDLHWGNIGYTQDARLVYFDLGGFTIF